MGGFKFKAPRINLDRPTSATTATHSKCWQNTTVSRLNVGDIIAGHGKVLSWTSQGSSRTLVVGEGSILILSEQDSIFAFTEKGD